jgi:hypothetical protein
MDVFVRMEETKEFHIELLTLLINTELSDTHQLMIYQSEEIQINI